MTKIMTKTLWIGLGCVVLAGFAYWRYTSASLERQNRASELIVGVMSGYVPFALVDQKGELEGFDIDVAKEIAARLGKSLVLKDMSLAPLLVALQQGKVDMVISGLSITKDRLAAMAMIHYQGETIKSFPLVFWKQVPEGIKVVEDLKNYPGAVVCVEPGSSQEGFLLDRCSFLNLKCLSSMSEIVMDLKYGKSTAAFIDPDVLPMMKEKNPELVWFDVPLPKEYQIPGNGIAIAKDNRALIDQITAVVAQAKADGALARLEQQWFKKGASNG